MNDLEVAKQKENTTFPPLCPRRDAAAFDDFFCCETSCNEIGVEKRLLKSHRYKSSQPCSWWSPKGARVRHGMKDPSKFTGFMNRHGFLFFTKNWMILLVPLNQTKNERWLVPVTGVPNWSRFLKTLRTSPYPHACLVGLKKMLRHNHEYNTSQGPAVQGQKRNWTTDPKQSPKDVPQSPLQASEPNGDRPVVATKYHFFHNSYSLRLYLVALKGNQRCYTLSILSLNTRNHTKCCAA